MIIQNKGTFLIVDSGACLGSSGLDQLALSSIKEIQSPQGIKGTSMRQFLEYKTNKLNKYINKGYKK